MGRTAPDWSGGLRTSTVFSLKDMAELAARLGSIVTFDRRGNVVFLEDFNDGLTSWTEAFSGAGGSSYLTSFPTRAGGFAVNLVPGQVEGNVGDIARGVAYPTISKVGLEATFVVPALMQKLYMGMYFDDGEIIYKSQFRYVHTTGILKVRTGDDEYGELDTISPVIEGHTNFNTVKLVVDLETMKYHRVIFNDGEYDASAHNLWTAATSGSKYMTVFVGCFNGTTGIIEVIIDNVILTQNEG